MIVEFLDKFSKSKSPGISALIYLFLKETGCRFTAATIRSELTIAKKNVDEAILFLSDQKFISSEDDFYFIVTKTLLVDEEFYNGSDTHILALDEQPIVNSSNRTHYYDAVKIIEDLNIKSKKQFSVSDLYLKKIEKHLKSGATKEDFYLVNTYFSAEWDNPEMSKHIAPITLYNGNFQSRVDQARNYLSVLNNYSESSMFVWAHLNELYIKYGLAINSAMEKKDMDQISFWCERYPVDTIINVVDDLFSGWWDNPEFSKFLRVGIIFSGKFQGRVERYSKVLENTSKIESVSDIFTSALELREALIHSELGEEEIECSLDHASLDFIKWCGGIKLFLGFDDLLLRQKCLEFVGS